MKRFLLIVLVCILNSNITKSQEVTFIKVTYSKELYSRIDTSKSNEYKVQINNLNSLVIKNSKELEYQLVIDNYHSIFKGMESKMDNKENEFKGIARKIGGTNGQFYVNKKDSIFYNKKHFGGEDFKIKIDIKKWEITNEFKFIRNFKCYKAVSQDFVSNSEGVFKFNIIAWFCPELPSFFGPAGYFGLPGLILELDNGKTILKAKEIKISKTLEEEIKPFKKGLEISQKEFDEFLEKKAFERYGKYQSKN